MITFLQSLNSFLKLLNFSHFLYLVFILIQILVYVFFYIIIILLVFKTSYCLMSWCSVRSEQCDWNITIELCEECQRVMSDFHRLCLPEILLCLIIELYSDCRTSVTHTSLFPICLMCQLTQKLSINLSNCHSAHFVTLQSLACHLLNWSISRLLVIQSMSHHLNNCQLTIN